MSLFDYSNEELQVELKRRDEIRNGAWPKECSLNFKPEDEDEVSDFLHEKCGIYEGTDTHSKIMDSLSELVLAIEVSKDDSISVHINNIVNEECSESEEAADN